MNDQPPRDPLPTDLAGLFEPNIPSDPRRQIYTNRNLNLARIAAIGFDMDYTVAPYHQPSMNELSIRCTFKKLIEQRGYPEEIRTVRLNPAFIIRGLTVDKQEGNIFKMDCHRHVGRCYHGYRPVPDDEVRALYGTKAIKFGSGERFAWIDTLFSLPEATMLAGIIEHWEGRGLPLPWTYRQLFDDIRACIDEAHRDNSMKREMVANLPTFIERDADLAATLHKLRSGGKKLFLLTNSEFAYTQAVMSHLLGSVPRYRTWQQYFDAVVVSAMKPSFFTGDAPFWLLDAEGNPTTQPAKMERGKVYAGGNVRDFEKMADLTGDRILYVGDHIYGDILRSKKSSIWRTAMVIQEMEETLQLTIDHQDALRRIHQLEDAVMKLDHEINYHLTLSKSLAKLEDLSGPEALVVDSTRDQTRRKIERKRALLRQSLSELEALEETTDAHFNPYWGRLFRESNERSQFGGQVEDFADVYTSRVSNFLGYSPMAYFRAPRDVMPHERGF